MFLLWAPAEVPNCDGQVAIITGGNRGIGLETVKGLCKANVTVIIGMYCQNCTELVGVQLLTTHLYSTNPCFILLLIQNARISDCNTAVNYQIARCSLNQSSSFTIHVCC